MDITPELQGLLAALEKDPAVAIGLIRQHAPLIEHTISKEAWDEGYQSGNEDGRDRSCCGGGWTTNPYDESILRRKVDLRYMGIVAPDDDTRLVLMRGVGDFDGLQLRDALWREYLHDFDWKWARNEVRHLVPADATTTTGVLITLDGREWVEPAFTEGTPGDEVTVTTFTRRNRVDDTPAPRSRERYGRLGQVR